MVNLWLFLRDKLWIVITDFEALFLRIQARFGEWPVLIQRVGDTPLEEWHFRSPRLEQVGNWRRK